MMDKLKCKVGIHDYGYRTWQWQMQWGHWMEASQEQCTRCGHLGAWVDAFAISDDQVKVSEEATK